MRDNVTSIKSFHRRWNVQLDEEKSWQIFTKRASNALSVIGDSIGNKEVETSFFHYVGELNDFNIGIQLPTFFEKISQSKIYNYFISENNYINFLLGIQAILYIPEITDAKKTAFSKKIQEAISISGVNVDLRKVKNEYLLFPKGAELLDIKLVNDVIDWISDYPLAYEKYKTALSNLGLKGKERIVLDDLRLSLELLLKEKLKNNKSLENQTTELGKLLKDCSSPEVRNLFFKILDFYKNYQNENVKHNDNIKDNEVELLLYQTGSLMRFIIQNS